jgi:PAS domain S-box-containing protein
MGAKHTEQALQDREARLRLLFDQMPGILWSVDQDLRFTSSVGGGLRALGLQPGQVVGMTLFEYFQTDDPAFAPIAAHQQALNGEVSGYEFEWEDRTFQTRVEPLRDGNGAITQAVGVAFDITEARSARDALRESEHRYRTLFEQSRDAIYVSTLGGALLDFNPSMLSLFGYSGEEMRQLKAEKLYADPADRLRFREAVEREGYATDYEVKLVAKDGRAMDCLVSSTAQYAEDGSLAGYQGIIRDITKRKQAEETLRKEKEFSEAATGSLPGLFYLFDEEGRFLRWNRNLERVSGYSSDEIARMQPLDFFTGDDKRIIAESFEEVFRKGHTAVEADLVSKDGTSTPHLFTGTMVTLDDRRCAVGAAIDVVERRRLEQQLRQSQKMEAVGQLAGGVAHDFNNVLTVVLSNSELLLRAMGPQDPRREELQDIREAAHRAASLTRQLLAFSRKQVLKPQVLNLNEVVVNVEKMLRRLIGEDIELVTMFEPQLWAAEADPGQIEQIVMNLAVNARDAMPDGGKLSIETGNVELDETFARSHYPIVPGRYVMVAMCDTGEGMDAETRSRIFEPFFTTKKLGKGTGLGLSTVYGIVKQSGGYIWAYSEEGLGTTFKIYFPRVEREAESLEPASVAPDPVSGSETVLLVEDNESVRTLARRILENEGYEVIEAHNAAQALLSGGRHEGRIDLLLTDLVMPEISGRELAEKMSGLRPEARVLFVSGLESGPWSAGAGFLQKPFTPDSLARKVREVLDGAQPHKDRATDT